MTRASLAPTPLAHGRTHRQDTRSTAKPCSVRITTTTLASCRIMSMRLRRSRLRTWTDSRRPYGESGVADSKPRGLARSLTMRMSRSARLLSNGTRRSWANAARRRRTRPDAPADWPLGSGRAARPGGVGSLARVDDLLVAVPAPITHKIKT